MESKIISNNIPQVQQLLRSGADINAKYKYNQTALILALENGHSDMALQLLNIPNIDVNATGKFKRTALMLAIKKGLNAVATQLLDIGGINVNAKSMNGKTALMLAIETNNNAIAQRLIATPGIDLKAKDTADKTAIMFAAYTANAAILRLLAKKLPDYNFQETDIYGHNILDLSKRDATKYLIYSGKVLFKENDIFSETKIPIQILNNICSKNYLNTTLSLALQAAIPLQHLNTSKNSTTILLASKACGLSFTESFIKLHTTMPLKELIRRNLLMRIAALTKISYGLNLYMVIHILLLRKPSKWLFTSLPKATIANVLDFLAGDHFDFNMCKLSSTNTLAAIKLTRPPMLQAAEPLVDLGALNINTRIHS